MLSRLYFAAALVLALAVGGCDSSSGTDGSGEGSVDLPLAASYDLVVLEAVATRNRWGNADSIAVVLGVTDTLGRPVADASVSVTMEYDRGNPPVVNSVTDSEGEVEVVFPGYAYGSFSLVVVLDGETTLRIEPQLDLPVALGEPSVGLRGATITWVPSEHGRFVSYSVLRRSAGGEFEEVGRFGQRTVMTYRDDDTIPGTVYTYRVDTELESGRVVVGWADELTAGLRASLDVRGNIRDIIHDPSRGRIYVSVSNDYYGGEGRYPGGLFVINAESMDVVEQIEIGGGGRGPAGLALSSDSRSLHVAVPGYRNLAGSQRLVTVDLDNLSTTYVDLTAHLRTPWWVFEQRPGRLVVIANASTSVHGILGVASVDPSNGAVTPLHLQGTYGEDENPAAFGYYANGVTVSPNGDRAFVSGRNSNGAIWQVDFSDDTPSVESHTRTGSYVNGIQASDALVFAVGSVYDGADLSPVGSTVRGTPALSPDGNHLYVFPSRSVATGEPIVVYDARTAAPRRTIPTAVTETVLAVVSPAGVGYVVDDGDVYALPLD